jgi:hypothetical protein
MIICITSSDVMQFVMRTLALINLQVSNIVKRWAHLSIELYNCSTVGCAKNLCLFCKPYLCYIVFQSFGKHQMIVVFLDIYSLHIVELSQNC